MPPTCGPGPAKGLLDQAAGAEVAAAAAAASCLASRTFATQKPKLAHTTRSGGIKAIRLFIVDDDAALCRTWAHTLPADGEVPAGTVASIED